MKLPIIWLKEYVHTRLSSEKIAEDLTMVGLEVDEISHGHNYSGVVVGHVLSVEKHPNATKLNIASVDVGGEILQIVCGAPNLKAGQKVPVAIVGAKLGDYEISKASLRGVDSHGMICSEKELGLGDDHSGIMVLEKGEKVGEIYVSDKGSDTVLDVKVLANRPDCMSVIGLAREVSVVTGSAITLPTVKIKESTQKLDFAVEVQDENLCPRYMARAVTGLVDAETPKWMKDRLMAVGVRPISLFVDISNYVMFEYGQPLHFFDLDKLTDKKIIVRAAKSGEVITTLDGVKRKLSKDNLVIADKTQAIAIAGVMGGANTEIDGNTKNILVEAAVFDKASIRRTSRSLGLRSEAVARFEKGIPVSLPEMAIDRAVQLLQDLGKGVISRGTIDISQKTTKAKPITFDHERMNAFLGTKISEKDALGVLTRLGFEMVTKGKVHLVTPPVWRIDIVEDVDLYEEVIRILGYDLVPATLPHNVDAVANTNKYYKATSLIRHHLSSIGFDEIMTYSFVGANELAAVGMDIAMAPVVQNPLDMRQQHMRSSMVPQMLGAIRDNQHHREILRFFEIGKSFEIVTAGKLPQETNWLVLGLNTDFYDAKGMIYNLLNTLSIPEDEVVVKPTTGEYLKKGIGADLFVQGKRMVSFGEVLEDIKQRFDIKKTAVVAKINLDILLALQLREKKFEQFSKYQMVTRDVSAVFGMGVTVAEIKHKLTRSHKLVQKAEITDIYQGKGLAGDDRSITIRLYIQSVDHTLTDAEVDEVMKIIHNKITENGGKIRSGS